LSSRGDFSRNSSICVGRGASIAPQEQERSATDKPTLRG